MSALVDARAIRAIRAYWHYAGACPHNDAWSAEFTMGDICAISGVPRATMHRYLKRLLALGYIDFVAAEDYRYLPSTDGMIVRHIYQFGRRALEEFADEANEISGD